MLLISGPWLLSQTPAATGTAPVKKEKYEELKSEVKFDKTKNALRPKETKPEPKPKKKKEKNNFSWRGVSTILELFSYTAIAAIISFLVYFIFSNIKEDQKVQKLKAIEEIENEHIADMPLVNLLTDALAKEDYRSAVRYQFLSVLQTLSNQEIIDWKIEKTNRDYNRELRGKKQGISFQWASNLYEQIWYGKHEISKEAYFEIEPSFEAIIKTTG